MKQKLEAKGLHSKVVRLIMSWLRDRIATVLVSGEKSDPITLANMVFQGTVWGPCLWDLFFEDAQLAIQDAGFEEVVFADDLNAFKAFDNAVPNEELLAESTVCQIKLHGWGLANRVKFDPKKESHHIISRMHPYGDIFKILGVGFDCKLSMSTALAELVTDCNWKLRSIIRTNRFYSPGDLIFLFKSHLLSFIEYRTAAIYHACFTDLMPLDNILQRFLREAGVFFFVQY
jgi:hypothetical protein